jgi:integrase
MATLSTEKYKLKNGKAVTAYRIVIKRKKQRSHAIRLGTVNKQQAEVTRNRINAIEASLAIGCSFDADTAAWLSRIEDWLYDKLVKAGLVPPRQREEQAVVTLGQHLERYFGSLGRQKPTTARNYARARRLVEEHFGKERTLDSITEGDADAYKRWLLDRYAPASASVDLRRARQFFKAAVRRRLIAVNPFADVPCGPQTNDDRIFYVSPEVIERVIAVCPDNDWRLIFALPRYGGVRFPSEVEDLKWSDIDWENSRFSVHEKKVEHHPGRGVRVVPIFSELRPHLERAFRERPPGAIYVVPRARGGRNLGTHAKRLVAKAGVAVWPKMFVNLRGSRSDDLDRNPEIKDKAIDAWIGNSEKIRRRHYHGVRPEDWAAATGAPTTYPSPYPSPAAAVSGHQEPSTLHESREKSLDVVKDAENQYPRQGSNLRPMV